MNYLHRLKQSLDLTKAEDFPTHIRLDYKDYIALTFIPLIFLNAYIFAKVFELEPIHIAMADSLFRGFLFGIICLLYGKILKLHWQNFNRAKWTSWLLVIVGGLVLQMIISLTRMLLAPLLNSAGPAELPMPDSQQLPEFSPH